MQRDSAAIVHFYCVTMKAVAATQHMRLEIPSPCLHAVTSEEAIKVNQKRIGPYKHRYEFSSILLSLVFQYAARSPSIEALQKLKETPPFHTFFCFLRSAALLESNFTESVLLCPVLIVYSP